MGQRSEDRSTVRFLRSDQQLIGLSALIALPMLAFSTLAAQSDPLRQSMEAYVDRHQPAIVRELVELLEIPNVAADRANIRRNATQLAEMLARRGFEAETWETAGNPLVYGERRAAGATRTLLVYAHYDGQPVDPRAWKQSDPFVPRLRRGRLEQDPEGRSLDGIARFEPDWRVFARSASDDKSPIVALLTAIDALASIGRQPTATPPRDPRWRGGGGFAQPRSGGAAASRGPDC